MRQNVKIDFDRREKFRGESALCGGLAPSSFARRTAAGERLPASAQRLVVHRLQVRARRRVDGLGAVRRIQQRGRVVDGVDYFAETGRDELDLAVVAGDVARREDARQVRFHLEVLDDDGVVFQL